MGNKLSILVVTAGPDDRESTKSLREVVHQLRTRADVSVEVWHLRPTPGVEAWGSRVVDTLRTSPVASVVGALGGETAVGKLRGARLRGWLHHARPDVVLLDDGLGGRILRPSPRTLRIARWNPEPPHPSHRERPTGPVDLHLVTTGSAPPPGSKPTLDMPLVHDYWLPARRGDLAVRRATRRLLSLPDDLPLVVGWGRDGWVDGPDLFVRALWALERHHGCGAHGVWLGLGDDLHEVETLMTEAERCGLSGRFHVRADDSMDALLCGDAVLLPYRSGGDPHPILTAVTSGLRVVTFPVGAPVDPSIVVVPHLDVEAAAAELAESLRSDRVAEGKSARLRVPDVRPFVDELLSTIDGLR